MCEWKFEGGLEEFMLCSFVPIFDPGEKREL